MNSALLFTLLRLGMCPLFPILYLGYERLGLSLTALPFVMLVLFALSESFDLIDGILARKYNQVTDLGKVLDPMADSVTRLSLFLAFTQGFLQLPLMMVLLFLYRDFFISTLRLLCALRGVALAARFSGKLKSFVQGCTLFLILFLMIAYTQGILSLELFQQISFFAVSFAAIFTIVSAADYIYNNRLFIKRALLRV